MFCITKQGARSSDWSSARQHGLTKAAASGGKLTTLVIMGVIISMATGLATVSATYLCWLRLPLEVSQLISELIPLTPNAVKVLLLSLQCLATRGRTTTTEEQERKGTGGRAEKAACMWEYERVRLEATHADTYVFPARPIKTTDELRWLPTAGRLF